MRRPVNCFKVKNMKKAQLLSLDLLIALVAIVFALGLLVQLSETRIYSQKEETMQKELESIGNTAAVRLVGNPDIICSLTSDSGTHISYLENCIDTAKINQPNLGIPQNYGFALFEKGNPNPIAGTAIPTAPAPKNVFAEKRIVVTHSGPLSKSDFEKCLAGPAGNPCLGATNRLAQNEITLYLWRQ